MTGRTTPVLVVGLVLVVAAVSPTAAAQSTPRTVLLDEDTRHVGTIAVDGQTYRVYHHDNLVPWASGVAMYADGRRVTEKSTARTVLTALARRRAVRALGPSEAELLRSTAANASAAADAVSNATAAIDATRAALAAAKNRSTGEETVYNESVEAAPTIESFDESATALAPELRSFEADADAYVENATRLATLLERRANGTAVDPQRLYARYTATIDAMERLSGHTDYSGVGEELRTVAAHSEAVSRNVSSVPDGGEALADRFARTHDRLAAAANATGVVSLPEFAFEEPRDTARSLRSAWLDGWEERRAAPTTVYETLAGVAAVGLLVVGVGWWRRR